MRIISAAITYIKFMFAQSDDKVHKSYEEHGTVYFWTATINGWNRLMAEDHYKDELITGLRSLSERGMVQVFGFVIMPNHIHLIWRIIDRNGKEDLKARYSSLPLIALSKCCWRRRVLMH